MDHITNPNEKNDDGSYVLSGDELREWWRETEARLDEEDDAFRPSLPQAYQDRAQAAIRRQQARRAAEDRRIRPGDPDWIPVTEDQKEASPFYPRDHDGQCTFPHSDGIMP